MGTGKLLKVLTFNTVFFAVLSTIEILIGITTNKYYSGYEDSFFATTLPYVFLASVLLSISSNILLTFIKYHK